MKYKAIVFDLDGTLLNTLHDISHCANIVLKERGFPTYKTEEFKYFVGEGVYALFNKTLPEQERNEETIASCAEDFREVYKEYDNKGVCRYDGIDDLLNTLTSRNIKMTILSNKPHELTQIAVAEYLPDWRFERILGQREAIPPKPDPAGVLEIINFLDEFPMSE